MKQLLSLVSLTVCLSLATTGNAEKRFGRSTIKVANPEKYTIVKVDDVNRPTLAKGDLTVSCLVYRGTERYYVEAELTNKGSKDLIVPSDFIKFEKRGYQVLRTDTIAAAQEIAGEAGGRFVPTPPPQMPANSTTTVNGTATTYGNQTQVSGTARTTYDNSAQAGANFGNAIGNAIAARQFYNGQSVERKFAHFLGTFAQGPEPIVIKPGESRIITCTYEQMKNKKAPFHITMTLSGESFQFDYAE